MPREDGEDVEGGEELVGRDTRGWWAAARPGTEALASLPLCWGRTLIRWKRLGLPLGSLRKWGSEGTWWVVRACRSPGW